MSLKSDLQLVLVIGGLFGAALCGAAVVFYTVVTVIKWAWFG